MTDIPAAYFDGRTSQSHAVTLRWHAFDGQLEVRGAGIELRYPRQDVTVESRLGRGPRFVRFADGGRCEVADSPEFDAVIATWAPNRPASLLHRLESSWAYVAVALVLLGGLGWAAFEFGLPWAARKVAFVLPADITRSLGDHTLATLDQTMLQRTQLTHERQLALREQFARFLAQSGQTAPHAIEFREMRGGGPNAFALPSGVIVITDDLISLAKDDREIVAVLAHECGHLEHRHALRGVLQHSVLFVLLALVTGDVTSSTTAFGGALPAYLLQTKFSRTFEREADAHAVVTLRRAGIPPDHLATMLKRLAEGHEFADSRAMGYLSTHPPSAERIEAITGKR